MTFRSTNPDSLEELLTEQQNQNSADIDLKSTAEIVQIFHREDRIALAAVEAETDAIVMVVEAIAATFHSGGRLFYVGAGTSGPRREIRRRMVLNSRRGIATSAI